MSDKTYSFRLWYQVLTDESQRGSAMLLHRVSDKDRPQPKIPLPFSRKEFDVFAGVYFRSPQGMHSWMLVCLSCGDHSWIDPLYRTGVCSKCSSKARPRVRRYAFFSSVTSLCGLCMGQVLFEQCSGMVFGHKSILFRRTKSLATPAQYFLLLKEIYLRPTKTIYTLRCLVEFVGVVIQTSPVGTSLGNCFCPFHHE